MLWRSRSRRGWSVGNDDDEDLWSWLLRKEELVRQERKAGGNPFIKDNQVLH